jgi:hypothetical protein
MILEVVIQWLVSGLFEMTIAATDYVLSVFGAVWAAFGGAGAGLLEAFTGAGNAILGVRDSVMMALVRLSMNAGLAAPLATLLVFTVVMVATAAILRATLNGVYWFS